MTPTQYQALRQDCRHAVVQTITAFVRVLAGRERRSVETGSRGKSGDIRLQWHQLN